MGTKGGFISEKKAVAVVPLDKTAQVATSTPEALGKNERPKGRKALQKRSKRVLFDRALKAGLAHLGSPLEKSYCGSMKCSGTLHQVGGKLVAKYCRQRWCGVCSAIKTAQLIEGYLPEINALPNTQLVTLTLPNVADHLLRAEIERMTKIVQDIQNTFLMRKKRGLQSWALVGIRALECTHNSKTDMFHPHFHFIISGEMQAKELIRCWLDRVPTATYKAQDYREAMKGTEKELFKYAVKFVETVDGKKTVITEALDVIFQAMKGKRAVQSMGLKKQIKEEELRLESTEVEGLKELDEGYTFTWEKDFLGWVNYETGEVIGQYVLEETMRTLLENIVCGIRKDHLRGVFVPVPF